MLKPPCDWSTISDVMESNNESILLKPLFFFVLSAAEEPPSERMKNYSGNPGHPMRRSREMPSNDASGSTRDPASQPRLYEHDRSWSRSHTERNSSVPCPLSTMRSLGLSLIKSNARRARGCFPEGSFRLASSRPSRPGSSRASQPTFGGTVPPIVTL